jgi:hypothetical protein
MRRLAFLLLASCGSSPAKNTADGGPGGGGVDATPRIDARPRPDALIGACPAETVFGKRPLMTGGDIDDTDFAMSPFDLHYVYLSGDVPDVGTCTGICASCSVGGSSCVNSGSGCDWWGCWQYDQDKPGEYVSGLISSSEAANAIPAFSYYVWYTIAGNIEQKPEIDALQDTSHLTRYFADFAFLMDTIAAATSKPVIVHVEPDLWGYGEAYSPNHDPSMTPVPVAEAAPSDCGSLPDTFAGFAQCFVKMGRDRAPNVLIAIHASSWGEGDDVMALTDPTYDVDGHADTTAAFYTALGADFDLVYTDMADRDAAQPGGEWWDATDTTYPNFARAIHWLGRVGDDLNKPVAFWQVPFGHVGMADTSNMYSDNRMDYFFDHPERFAAAGIFGVFFGGGQKISTFADTDGGHFDSRAAGYYAAARPSLCEGHP